MASSTEAMSQSLFASEGMPGGHHKTIPILPSSNASSLSPGADAMEVTPQPTLSMGPPLMGSPIVDRTGPQSIHVSVAESDNTMNGGSGAAVGAAAAAQQPKVVQTAFIHKLYK